VLCNAKTVFYEKFHEIKNRRLKNSPEIDEKWAILVYESLFLWCKMGMEL
jgi:hypothetical protein